jgi:hypothetical protein
MIYFKEEIPNKDSKLIYIYQNITVNRMQNEVEQLMTSLGYKQPEQGHFEKGNKAMRLLLGAFFPYFKFRVDVEDYREGQVQVTVSKETTLAGLSGGLFSIHQVKKESDRLAEAFRTI